MWLEGDFSKAEIAWAVLFRLLLESSTIEGDSPVQVFLVVTGGDRYPKSFARHYIEKLTSVVHENEEMEENLLAYDPLGGCPTWSFADVAIYSLQSHVFKMETKWLMFIFILVV